MNSEQLIALFAFSLSPWEMVLRGTAVYWFLLLLFRFVLRRDVGAIGIADILLLVLIADASQNAMAGAYQSIADGFVLVATIAGWNLLLDWASFRSQWLRALLDPPPLVLVRRGRLMRAAMRQQLITVPELLSKLREQGIDKLAEVKIARMESDGELSVIRSDAAADPGDAPASKGPSLP